MRYGTGCILCSRTDNHWKVRGDQRRDPLLSLLIEQQGPVTHGSAVNQGGHAGSDEGTAFVDKSRLNLVTDPIGKAS